MSIENDEREALLRAVQSVTWNALNYPAKAQVHILGQDIVPLTVKIADSVQAAGFCLPVQGQPSDAMLTEIGRRVYDECSGQVVGVAKALIRAGWEAALRSPCDVGGGADESAS